MTRPRAVLDCNVLLQALISESGPSAQALRLMERGLFDLQLSKPVLGELRDVLKYPVIRARNPELSDVKVAEFIARLLFRGSLVRRVRHVFDYPRARQDEPYIDLAVASRSDFLVTRDRDLLSLRSGRTELCNRFRRMTHPLVVVEPVEFMYRITDEWRRR